MLEPTSCRFWQVALQSGLMEPAGLQACWDALPEDKRTPDAIDRRLARQAVQSGLLTLWQAQQLVAGRSTGYRIDRYVLLELIGQGGMGRVYLAKDTRLNRRVAIKILSPERVNNPRAIARFHREAMVGAQLQHENLVRIYDEGESNGRCYLVMEYIEGRNIGQMIAESGPIPAAVAARLTRQVALGLEHAHRKGLIHRDVNPYNILVTRDGVAKLTDMGLAIDLADQDRVTRDGATVGTFDYVSPEQARHSHGVDTRSDIYSLGCTLYHMLSGRVPFPSASLPEKLFGHQAAEAESLTSLVPGIPAGLAAVVTRMMRKAPEERFATPLELAAALEPYADDMNLGLSGDVTPPVESLAAVLAAAKAAAAPPSRSTPAGLEPTIATPVFASPENAAVPASAPAPAPAPDPTPVPVATAVSAQPASKPSSSPAGRGALNIGVDFGPEPSLTESLSTRTKPRTREKAAPARAATPRAPSARMLAVQQFLTQHRKRWPIAAGVAGVLLALLAFAVFRPRPAGPPQGTQTAANSPGGTGKSKSGEASSSSVPKAVPPKKRVPVGKEVAVVAGDGTMSVEPDLRTAIRSAIGSKGHVLLLNAKPLEFKADEAIVASGGHLVMRAGEGVKPVLEVEVKGRKPFLATKTDATLELEGVTIAARFVSPGPEPAPIIDAGNNVKLERCVFLVRGEPGKRETVPGSRAVVLEGGTLAVNGCLFQGFDRALDVSFFSGVSAGLKHCMFVHAGGSSSASGNPASAETAWAVRLRAMPGGASRAGRKLTLDHCTVVGSGLFEMLGFSPGLPAKLDVLSSAIQVGSLLSWDVARTGGSGKTSETVPPSRDAVSWRGEGNQYDIRGSAWVVLGPKGGPFMPQPGGPTDLATWERALGNERDVVPPPVRFVADQSTLPEHPAPADFAVASQGAQTSVGADPANVGPTGRPSGLRTGSGPRVGRP